MKELGSAKRINIDRENTTIIDGGGDRAAIEGRVKQIRARSTRPPPTTTGKSSRSAWPSWPAALR